MVLYPRMLSSSYSPPWGREFVLWWQYVSPYRWHLPTSPRGITVQRTNIDIVTAVSTWDRTSSLSGWELTVCSKSSALLSLYSGDSAHTADIPTNIICGGGAKNAHGRGDCAKEHSPWWHMAFWLPRNPFSVWGNCSLTQGLIQILSALRKR
jgi:hypothetical protein